MNVFEILGPAMVGPSSSHTAGAVRIGYICGKLMGEKNHKCRHWTLRFIFTDGKRPRHSAGTDCRLAWNEAG